MKNINIAIASKENKEILITYMQGPHTLKTETLKRKTEEYVNKWGVKPC